MKTHMAVAASAIALLLAAPASATIFINTGAGAIQPDENLLFTNNPANGTTIQGITNQTNTLVSISGGETLVGNGGQARVESLDGLVSTPFTYNGLAGQSLGFDLTDPALAFTETEFRIFVGKGTATQATLTFVDTSGGTFTQTFAIPANGFFNATTADGQLIDYFSIAANGSFQDVRQTRLGGVGDINGPGGGLVPEPASWAMMIMGFGGLGALMRGRRRGLAFTSA
jgi:hypothetical protein